MAASPPMLTARHVTFTYRPVARSQPPVLADVSLDLPRGSVVGLLGPNGSGKTTLLKVLGGMLAPQSGQVELDGRPLTTWSRRALARQLAFVPQDTHSPFDFSALDLVLMGRYAHLGPLAVEGADDIRIAREAMAATGTAEFERRAFSTLSGGERQRVVIASALAQSSEILLLDEPTAALDLRYQFEIADLLRRINTERRTTIVISTHDLHLAALLCDTVVVLQGGRVARAGATHEVITPDALRALYGIEAEVVVHPATGRLSVTPLGRSTDHRAMPLA